MLSDTLALIVAFTGLLDCNFMPGDRVADGDGRTGLVVASECDGEVERYTVEFVIRDDTDMDRKIDSLRQSETFLWQHPIGFVGPSLEWAAPYNVE